MKSGGLMNPEHPEHKVHALATVAAVVSCIGLVIGNLIGLILAIISLRHMDRAKPRYHGYRMLFTGWFMGVVGLSVYPIVLNIAYVAYLEGNYATAFANVLTVMVVAPIIMIAYAWQDRLPEERTVEGYRFLGRHQEPSPLDVPLTAVVVVIGLLTIFGIEPALQHLATVPRSLAGGLFLIVAGMTLIFKRRGTRVLLMFIIISYFIRVAFHLALGTPDPVMDPTLEQEIVS